ncbi:GNAT family N-acetyltransferase [Chitinolyticbacter albus]|uniref:GNAT family N-acetyltransferase n=1 Tax=Chitinolyticbacter albus TaxID=2961951 RepID=UPI00210DD327|nr:GNAT family N-acetyltransferase [Chitinolyticbacter albus]
MPNPVVFDFDLAAMDWPRITGWLASSYWSPGISQRYVEQGARASTVVIGAFVDGVQVGYGRAVSDTVRFLYLADIYVDEAWRGRGIASELVRQLLAHPLLAQVASGYLLTGDAHALYRRFGFDTYPTPERFILRRNPDALDFTED